MILEMIRRWRRVRELEGALRDAFPHFQDDEPITRESIRAIGREWTDMTMGWEPRQSEIEFVDNAGNMRKLVYEEGDASVGIGGGWALADDEPL